MLQGLVAQSKTAFTVQRIENATCTAVEHVHTQTDLRHPIRPLGDERVIVSIDRLADSYRPDRRLDRRLAPALLRSSAAYPDRAQHARRSDPGCCSETTPAQPPVRSSRVEPWPASRAAGCGKARPCRLPGRPRLYLCCVRDADHGQDWCRNCCYQEEVIGILTAKLQPSLALPLHQYPRRYRWT